MTKDQIVENIANIQYFVKTNVFGKVIHDKQQYFERIKNTYKDMSVDEVRDNYEEIRYLGVGAIKSDIEESVRVGSRKRKQKAYEEYLCKCGEIDVEMESELYKCKVLKELTIDSINEYIKNKL